MIILDSDHLSILQHPESPKSERLISAMDLSSDAHFATTTISFEEQMRAWLAAINRKRQVHEQLLYYSRLRGLIDFYSRWEVLLFNEEAADRFVDLRRSGIRIGTIALKIATIALANAALLLSANLPDFERVPGLRVES